MSDKNNRNFRLDEPVGNEAGLVSIAYQDWEAYKASVSRPTPAIVAAAVAEIDGIPTYVVVLTNANRDLLSAATVAQIKEAANGLPVEFCSYLTSVGQTIVPGYAM